MNIFMIISEGERERPAHTKNTHKKHTNKQTKQKQNHFVHIMNKWNTFDMYSTRDKCLLYVAHQLKYKNVTKFVKLFSRLTRPTLVE